jgi:hypothetical protein
MIAAAQRCAQLHLIAPQQLRRPHGVPRQGRAPGAPCVVRNIFRRHLRSNAHCNIHFSCRSGALYDAGGAVVLAPRGALSRSDAWLPTHW